MARGPDADANPAAADGRPRTQEAAEGVMAMGLDADANPAAGYGRPCTNEAAEGKGDGLAAERVTAREPDADTNPAAADGSPCIKKAAEGKGEEPKKFKKTTDDPKVGEDPTADEAGKAAADAKKPTADDLKKEGDGVENPTADEAEKAREDDPKKEGQGGEDSIADEDFVKMAKPDDNSGGEDARKHGDRSSEESAQGQGPWRSIPTLSVRTLVTRLGTAGEKLQTCCSLASGYNASVMHLGDFLRRVGSYAPNSAIAGQSPAALRRIAQACNNAGELLGHASSAVQGATTVGQLFGAGLRRVARLYGPEVAAEAEQKPKPKETSDSLKITVHSVEQAIKVIKWVVDSPDVDVLIDVGLDVTPFMAVKIFEEFRSHGVEMLSLISASAVMKAKRAAFYAMVD